MLCTARTMPSHRVVHGLGQPTGWVGLGWIGLDWVGSRFFDFWWVGLGRGSETAETQKLKIFICAVNKPITAGALLTDSSLL